MPKTDTINIHYHEKNGYNVTPKNTDIDPSDTVKFVALNQSATLCFSPTTTIFGATQNVEVNSNGTSVNVPADSPDFVVSFCAAPLNGSCNAGSTVTDSVPNTIKVGSGSK